MTEGKPWWTVTDSGTGIVGYVGVDAGLMYIGDPCYIVSEDSQIQRELAKGDKDRWSEFLDLYCRDTSRPVYPVEERHGGSLAIVTGTGYGDGMYPVTATLKDGRVASVTVTFIPDEEEDEDEAA